MKHEDNYLQHYGIQGQHWGIRRFQNKDGTLTPDGKERYKRGKEYSKELYDTQQKERDRLLKNSKEYQKVTKEADRIATKYDLDRDDGGGGNHERFSDDELRRAGDRYFQLSEDANSIDERLTEKALENAKKYITDKYGDQALSDIDYYNDKKTTRAVIALVSILGGVALINALKPKKSR